MNQRKIIVKALVPPNEPEAGIKEKELRVCAYCRVSTDQEEQLSSYQVQVEYYTEKTCKPQAGGLQASMPTRESAALTLNTGQSLTG